MAIQNKTKHHTLFDTLHGYTVTTVLPAVVHGDENLKIVEDRGGEHRKNSQRFQQRMVAAADDQLLLLHCYRSGANNSLSTREAAQLYPKTSSRKIYNIKHHE